jgi:drug/metabolite transporter (DMT)-like permease
MPIPVIAAVAAECMLSAYPLLVRGAKATMFMQVLSRSFVFALLSLLASLVLKLGHSVRWQRSLIVGSINVLHVYCSFTAFMLLPTGTAMAILYTAPFWTLVIDRLVFSARIPMNALPFLGLSFVGVIFLVAPSVESLNFAGTLAALIGSITESAMYFHFRSSGTDTTAPSPWPFQQLLELYGGSTLLSGVLVLAESASGARTSARDVFVLLAFNAIVGFGGTVLRAFAIPRLSTVVFNSLSLVSVVSGFLFGVFLLGDAVEARPLVGAVLVVVANVVLLLRDRGALASDKPQVVTV